MGDFTTLDEVLAVYRKRAPHYDVAANLYYLIGFREQAYRRAAVDALHLSAGDTVVEIGCGTGLNFSLLQEKIGPKGRIIGIDPTDAMLAQARRRAAANGWSNVTLIESTGAAYRFPDKPDAVLSTFALTLDPDYERVIINGASAMEPGGRWVVADLKVPSNWLRHLAPLLVFLTRPFAVSLKLADRHPWEAMELNLDSVVVREVFLGFAYIAVGEARPVLR